jgi:hypothetical protein
MSIELNCTGCGQMLRVADEHAGKKARCPACGTIVEVPSSAADLPPGGDSSSPFAGPFEPASKPNPFADRPEQTPNPYSSPSQPAVSPGGYQRAHRGGMILTFGIIGVLCCMPLGIAAWVMGASDLAEIRAGRMDPAGMDTTRVGMILGMVSVGIAVLSVLAQVLMLGIGAAM